MLSMTGPLRSYGERMRGRPDSEHNQALLRAVIVTLLPLQTALVAARQPERAARLWAIKVSSVAFSLLLLARIVRRPEASPRRRVLGAVHDNVADEVVRCIQPTDMLARLGGDEFTVVLDGPPSADHAKRVADRIIRGVEAIRSVDGHTVDVSVSIGISFIPAGPLGRRLCSEALLRAADEAMYVAKRSGKGRCRMVDFEAGTVLPAA
jgi:hypothetical protein